MKYSSLGKSALKVSRLALGTWAAYGWESSDEKEFIQVLHTALDAGVNFFDAAPSYGKGDAEKLLGKTLARTGRREELFIATKTPHHSGDQKKIRESFEQSLRNLQTDYIDLFQQHWPPKDEGLDDSIEMLLKLQQEGKVRAIGVSNWMEEEWKETSLATEIDSLQSCYNLFWREPEKMVIPRCAEHNIALLPYSPLAQGLLTGRGFDLQNLPRDARRQNVLFREEHSEEVQFALQSLRTFATERDVSLAELSLSWLLHQPGVTSVVLGCSRKDQLEQNLRSIHLHLSEDDLKRLSSITESFKSITSRYKSLWDWHPRR